MAEAGCRVPESLARLARARVERPRNLPGPEPDMANPPPTTETDPVTQDFIADRQRFWGSFTGMTKFAVIGIVVLLLGMLVFLV